MKTNEIRIGNFLKVPDRKRGGFPPSKIGVVSGILNGSIYIDGNLNDTYLILTVNPIQLTEELLLKCGFEVEDGSCVFKMFIGDGESDYKTSLQHWIGTNHISVCRAGISALSVDTMYLHQLQNLYFALTGDELEIKL